MKTKIFILIIIFGLAWSILAQSANTSKPNIPPPVKDTSKHTVQNIEKQIIEATPNNLDRSIGVLNVVATLMGVLVGLITLILLIATGFGIFEYRRWREIRKQMEKYKDEAKKSVEEIKPIIEGLMKRKEEADRIIKEIHIPSLPEKPSEEIKEKLDEYGKKIEFLEAFGISLKPEDYVNRGIDFYYKKQFELALKAFEKAIELKSNDAATWYNKGVMLGELNRHDEALKTFEKAIELKPDFAEALDGKGSALYGLIRYDEALKASEKAIELKPDFARAWSNKSAILNRLGRYDEAFIACDKAISIKPGFPNVWYNRACLYSLKEDKKNALSDLSRAIELDAKYKEEAKKDEDFKKFWDDEDFKKIVS